MVTHSENIEAKGTIFVVGGKEAQEERMQSQKKGALSKRIPLFVLFLFALALSVAFPFGMGLVVFVWVIALVGALFGVGFASFVLLREWLGKTSTFGYAPTTAYMTGKKMKKKREKESSDEETKDSR